MSGGELVVDVGRDGGASIEAEVDAYETRGSFGVLLRGHGGPAHVHCRLGGGLAEVASVERSNYYVEPDDETAVPVAIEGDGEDGRLGEPVEGSLELSTGYGAASTTIAVTVTPRPPPVEVDERLADPPDRGADGAPPSVAGVELDASAAGVVVLGLLAVVVAAATAAVVGGTVALVGFLFVTVGIVVAVAVLLA